jgi:hypothetical protein
MIKCSLALSGTRNLLLNIVNLRRSILFRGIAWELGRSSHQVFLRTHSASVE